MRGIIKFGMIVAMGVLSGCASVMNESSQPIRFETYSAAGEEIEAMSCKFENDYGMVSAKSPSTVLVHRSNKDVLVSCTQSGQADAKGVAISRANGGMFGNILLGGGIGAIIDHNRGTAYAYPSWIRLVVGKLIQFDRKDDKEGQVNVGQVSDVRAPQTP